MRVRFLKDIETVNKVLVAKYGQKGTQTGVQNHPELGVFYKIKLDEVIAPGYEEVMAHIDSVAEIPEEAPAVPARTKFFVKPIDGDAIDLTEYTNFVESCKELGSGINAYTAAELALTATIVGSRLMEYKALAEYSASEKEREAKLRFAQLVNEASGGSQDKREAGAKIDDRYQELLTTAAKLKALCMYVNDAFEYTNKMYYLFKAIYQGEARVPGDVNFRER